MPDEVKQDAIVPASAIQPSTELEKGDKSVRQTRLAAFTPVNLTEAVALSKMMAMSDMVPKDYIKKPGNILLAMQFGAEVGLAPLQSLQSIAVINGRPALWGDGALALVQGHPDFQDIIEETKGTTAFCTIKRRGRTPVTRSFSDDDAHKAGLLNKSGPWTNYRARMRAMRARGFALRDSFADVLKGISIAEEAMDVPIDNADVKKQREAGTLDLSSTLVESSEPNRGHGSEGMQRTQPAESQEPKKQDDWVCSDCSQTNKHDPTCKHFAKWQQDQKTSKPTTEVALRIDKIDKRTKKVADEKTGKKQPYLILTVTDADNLEWALYVWDTKFHKYLEPALGKMLICEFAQNQKGEKTYCSLEHILNLSGVQFVNDAPAVSGEMPSEAHKPGADDEEWDAG